ncbi:hypothetical protein AB6A40_001093 [Gnathostoma spinigerum]|uniref:Exocyst complex component 7 n=1 Tax=Gnathostoma spinigerum TaxID=75299 RepID=A0ABD6E3E0_9BILA
MMTTSTCDKKLQQDDEWLTCLEDNLSKSKLIRNRIINILDSFENRLQQLDESVVPLHNRTARLQIKQTNIAKLLKTIDATIQFYVRAAELEISIREGNPASALHKYLERMEQMAEAISFFSSHPTYRFQLENMKLTFESGCCALEKEFRSIVSNDSVIADAALIIESLDSDYEVISTRLQSVSTIRDTQRISEIVKWLLLRDPNRAFMEHYSTVRSDNMMRTLSTIVQHDTASRNTKNATFGRQEFRRPSSLSLKQAFMKATGRPSDKFGATRHWCASDPAVDGILLLLGSLLALIQLETEVMGKTIGDISVEAQVQRQMFIKPFRFVIERSNATLDNFNGSLVALLPLLRHVNAHYNQLTALANNAVVEVPYESFVNRVRNTCSTCLNQFLDHLVNDTNKFVPPDGNVHQITSNTLNFLSSLMDHRQTITQLLIQMASPNSNQTNQLPRLFARVLSALGLNLKNKVENYSDETLAAIFLLNNYNHIHTMLQHDGMFAVVCEHNTEVRSYYRSEIANLVGKYLQSWNRVVGAVSLSDSSPNDKQNFRTALMIFNSEVDKVISAQSTYCISDVNLARHVREEVKEAVLKPYAKFYSKLSATSFANSLEKNVKYTVESLEMVVDRLFDVVT